MFNVIIRYIFIFLLVTQYLWFDLIWSDFDVGRYCGSFVEDNYLIAKTKYDESSNYVPNVRLGTYLRKINELYAERYGFSRNFWPRFEVRYLTMTVV